MRLFIAIEFSEKEKTALMQSAEVLRASCARGNFSLRENYHLTLRFLGEAPPAKVKRITAAMDECRAAAFDVTVGRLGRFRRDGGDIFWREISAPRALNDLHRELSQRLAAAGFPPEERAFKPHLTLAREAVLRPSATLAALSAQMPALVHTADGMTLMRSERIGGKLTYTPLYKTAFRGV